MFGNKNNSQNIDGDVHKFKMTQGKILKSSDINLFDILDSRSNQSHLASDRTITIKYKDHKLKVFKPEGFDQQFSSNVLRVLETFYTSSVMTGVLCFLLVLFFLRYLLENSQSTFSMMFELLYEKIYDFYEEILGKEAKRILPYIISLFFVILGVNLLGVI